MHEGAPVLRGWRRLCVLLALGFPALCAAVPQALADPPRTVLSAADTVVPLSARLQVFTDPSGQWRPDVGAPAAAELRVAPPASYAGNFGTGSLDLWFAARLRAAPGGPTRWMWLVDNPGLDLVEVWSLAPGRPPLLQRAGDNVPPSQRAHAHRLPVVPLQLSADADTTVYMRVRTHGASQVPVSLWERDALAAHDQWSYALLSANFGLLAGLILYNLMLTFSIRDRAYLYYVGFATALTAWQFSNAGFLAQFLWPGSALGHYYATLLPLCLGGGLSMPFARHFLQTPQHAPRLDRAARMLTWAWGIVFLLCLLPPLSPGQLVAPWLVVMGTLLLIAMAVDGLRERRPAALPFTVAWMSLWAGSLLYVVYRMGWLAPHPLVINAPMIGASLEMVLLSFALADRFRRERQATERAQADRQRSELERDMVRSAIDEKSRFLAAVSHDMRQPLYALTLAVETLGRQRAPNESGPLLEQMKSALETADRLLDAVMTVARLETGSLQPRRERFSLEPLLERLDERFGPQARAKGLRWSITPCLVSVSTDPVLLQRIVANLVSNAVTYTERGGVLVSCRSRAKGVLLQVWDTGGGLPPEPEAQVFQRHFRGEAGTETDSGVGLGLVIVKQAATLLGLELSVRSRPGHGSCFSLWLPEVGETLATPAGEARGVPRPRQAALRPG